MHTNYYCIVKTRGDEFMTSIIDNLKVSNGTIDDLVNKKNNIWLGVSVSIKPYSEELARQYLKMIAQYTKNTALVFIGDELASINYHILDKYNVNKSLNKALMTGDLFLKKYETIINTLSIEEQNKLKVIRWKDAWTNKQEQAYYCIKEEYLHNSEFKLEVEKPLINYLTSKNRTINATRLEQLSEYVLRELPFILDGIEYEGIEYKTFLYPTYSGTTLREFATRIQTNSQFANLKKELGIKGNHILLDSSIHL